MLKTDDAASVRFDVSGEYRHWRLTFDGRVATLAMSVDEDGGLRPGYKLKLNSYDLGVDIELHDILQRIRFEHPQVACVVLTSARERMFCAGAYIYMLGTSSHAWKVNFCKFTNETRNGMEDSSRHDGLKFLAAINGTCAGGGYELALACDEILLIDDRSSAISLPEVPLLGVLPGTGGLTRVVDKRKVRRDLADMFCTNPDGVKAERAKEWGLVDEIAVPAKFPELVRTRAQALVNDSTRPAAVKGIKLTPLARRVDDDGYHYKYVDVTFDRAARTVTLTVRAPEGDQPGTTDAIHAMGDQWWPVAMARELDDAILMLRVNELELGLLLLKTAGSPQAVLMSDEVMLEHRMIGSYARLSASCAARSRGSMFPRAACTPSSSPVHVSPACCMSWRWLRIAATCSRFQRKAAPRRSLLTNSISDCCPPSMLVAVSKLGSAATRDPWLERWRRRASCSAPMKLSISASSRWRRTISTGKTRCAWPSKSGPV